MVKIIPVILSGGSGTRLWPLSRDSLPKQLLKLDGEFSLLQNTVKRTINEAFSPPILICNDEHRFMVAEQLRELEIDPSAIILEPIGRNTAPAAAIAAFLVSERNANALVMVLPSDHVVANQTDFVEAAKLAGGIATDGRLVTFGVTPTKPETGYGYIKRGAMIEDERFYTVDAFVEKPNKATAKKYIEKGIYYWNSGMFLFSPQTYINELKKYEPSLYIACETVYNNVLRDQDFIRLPKPEFAKVPSNSIDYAVMERTNHAVLMPVDLGWNDIGSWSALWDLNDKDHLQNVIQGSVIVNKVQDSYIYSQGPLVAVSELEKVIVVATDDALLVADMHHAQEVKVVVEKLKSLGRSEYQSHTMVYRPWGWYQTIGLGLRYQVKQICLKPGAAISLQLHHHRAEHWIVVEGLARITRNNEIIELHVNESTYIPLGATHRLENPGKDLLRIIEVQSGSYLGEDDIVRLEDNYGRG